MDIQQILDKIFSEKIVYDPSGQPIELTGEIDKEEGEFLRNLVSRFSPKRTIEIGCAYGISSLYICSALQGRDGVSHTIVDPFQERDWKNVGVNYLKTADVDFFKIIEKPSEIALPELLAKGEKFDFGFIDGWHTFDHTLLDFFYLNRLIDVGGVIVIDDVGMPAVSKVMRFIDTYPCYEMIGNVPIPTTGLRKFLDGVVKLPFKICAGILPPRLAHEFYSSSVVKSNSKLKLNSSMMAFKKVAEDTRDWNWHIDF